VLEDDDNVRLHGLFAQGSRALVIRRHGDETATFRWSLRDDSFGAGQRLAGRVYARRSDLSPGGGYLLFCAVDRNGDRWTGLSRAPLLAAQAYCTDVGADYGGGLFCGARRYWLNVGEAGGEMQGRVSGLERQLERPGEDWGPGCAGVYVLRLVRDGWTLVDVRRNADAVVTAHVFEKPLDERIALRKYAWTPPPWDDVTQETHELVERATGATESHNDWGWADVDRSRERLVWSVGGTLYGGRIADGGVLEPQPIVELGTYRFRR